MVSAAVTLASLYLAASQTFGLPPGLLSAVCFVESKHKVTSYRPHDGNADSIGVCQIQPPTARLMGFRGAPALLWRPEVNIVVAAAYLRYQLARYNRDIPKAIAAYNAGSHRRNAKGEAINREYVRSVMSAWADGR